MNDVRMLLQLVRADVLERTRQYSFLLTVAATLGLGYLIFDGTIGLHLGAYRGVMNAPWAGLMAALCTTPFLCLAGFYVVKNAIERDRQTGVGQILAATPMGRILYLTGKTLSNFVVLTTAVAVLAIGAIVLLLVQRTEGTVNLPALLLPFLWLPLPAMLFTAAMAVCFESTPGLRGGYGNVAYLAVWVVLLVIPLQANQRWADITGIRQSMDRLQADLRAQAPNYDGSFTLGMGGENKTTKPFRWAGMRWNTNAIGRRLLPVAWAAVLVGLAAIGFDRFDTPAKTRRQPARRLSRWLQTAFQPTALGLAGLERLLRPWQFGRLLVAELRLMLLGLPWWGCIAAFGLWVVSFVPEPNFSRSQLLPWLWVLPLFVWSPMGTREARYATGPVLFSCPAPLRRQLPGLWAAGFLVALALASGVLLRLVGAGEFGRVLAVGAGAAFIPSLALFLGVWSGGSKAFEAMYLLWWYVGPLQHTASLDFMATTDTALEARTPLFTAALSIALLLLALAGRRRQLTMH